MYIDQKAQEISLALIKISVYARRFEFRRNLERLSFQLLEEVSRRDFKPLFKTSMALESLIRFGNTIYEIEPINADILLQELNNLNSAVRQVAELSLPDSKQLPDIGSVFSKNQALFKRARKSSPLESRNNASKISGNPISGSKLAITNSAKELNNKKNKAVIASKQLSNLDDNPAIRQSAIVEKIRQSGNEPVKLKDIIAEFPKFSERTLRYDIQRLCNQGVLERTGTSGPSTYYKLREI